MSTTTIRSTTDADLRAELSTKVAERVEVALADPNTRAALAAKGISLPQAREFLYLRTYRALSAEAGL